MRYRIKDIAPLSSKIINPRIEPDTIWHLYSLPSFDNGQCREDVYGRDILSNKFIVPHKCILFNKLNVRFKRVWRINSKEEHLISSTEFLPLVPNEELVDYNYLYFILTSDYLTNYFDNQNSNTSGSHKRIDVDAFFDIYVDLPSLDIQKKIGEIISINDLISINTRINAELEAIAKQLYDYWFVQFDFPDKNGKPYKSSGGKMVWNEKLKREIPKGWEAKEISSILDSVKPTPRLTTDEYLQKGTYAIIDQTSDIYYAGFTNRDDAVSYQYPAVVFGDHSCSVKYVNFPYARGADGTQVMLSNNERVSVEYLYYAVKFIKLNKGYARHFSFVKDSLIIMPSHTIALNFKSIVERLFVQLTNNRKEIVFLTNLRDSLLPMLMNGQISIE